MLFAAAFFLFLSTPSARRATIDQQAEIDSYLISIHALREEGDTWADTGPGSSGIKFLSTPSARRATRPAQKAADRPREISIHALREEGDVLRLRGQAPTGGHFYPRPPRGGRPAGRDMTEDETRISIHALREEGDTTMSTNLLHRLISIHALREEGDAVAGDVGRSRS